MHKAAWVLWLTNQPRADSTVVPSSTVDTAVTFSVTIPDSQSLSSSVPAPDSESEESGTKSESFAVSSESVTSRYSSEFVTATGPVETPVLLPVSISLDQTISDSSSVPASGSTPATQSGTGAPYSEPSTGSESKYVSHPAFTPATAPAIVPASISTVSVNVVLPDSQQSITQYHTVSHYAPGPYPATAPGTAPAIAPASMTAAVVDDGSITVTHHGAAAHYIGDTLETLSQPWDEALFGSLESAVWSQDGQYLLFSDSEHAVLPASWSEDDRPDATKLGRIYKWDAATEEVSVFLESAGTIGPEDDNLPEVPALADKMTAGAVGLAWGWEAGDLLLTQYAMRRVVKLNVQDVMNGEVPIEKVVPWSGSMSPNTDEGSFNGPHNVFVANDVALFTDPAVGLELQAWDENGRKLPFSSQTTDQLKATAGATATNGVYAVDQHRSTHLIIDDIQTPRGVSWSNDRIFVSGSRAGTVSTPEQSGIFVYETERGDPTLPWQSKMIDGSVYMDDMEPVWSFDENGHKRWIRYEEQKVWDPSLGNGYFGSMALAGDMLLVAGPSGIYVVDSAKVELVGFVEFSKCFPVGIAAGGITSGGMGAAENYVFILTQCMDSGRPSLKRLELKSALEVAGPVDMCGSGESQSPVDLPACVSIPQPELSTDWGTVQMSQASANGLELSFDAPNWPPPSTTALGMEYHLKKCQLFRRSAHSISDEHQELELQCEHSKDFSDRLGVLSVFFIVGDHESAFLSQIEAMGSTADVDFDALFDDISDKSRYWSYPGSQTSTMCRENVDHFIIMEKVSMSMDQLLYFRDLAGTPRSPQPLSGRGISGCFGQPDWYKQEYGEHEWGYSVQGHHVVCDQGTKQSPINLEYCPSGGPSSDNDRMDRAGIDADWGSQAVEMENNGHSVVLTLQTQGDTKTIIEATSYSLVKCNLHLGSEHFIDSRQQAAELQCVHTKDSMPGTYGVIGLFLEGGKGSPHTFFSALGNLPSKSSAPQTVQGQFSRLLAINGATNYWSYEGSFTTPPCTEAVDWFVLMESESVSDTQLEEISIAIGWAEEGGNFRPPQPLHERVVHGCVVHKQYSYDDASEWGGVCQSGSEQSPIDLRSCAASQGLERPGRLNFDAWRLAPVKVRLSNTDGVTLTPFKDDQNPIQDVHHQPQEDNLYSIMSGTDLVKIMYKLEQCRIHWGSEHTVDGKQFMAEMHCVQRRSDDTRRYGVLGILWDVGMDSHEFWEPIENDFPQRVETQLRHYPGPQASATSFSAPATESVFDTKAEEPRRLQSSEPSSVPASAYGGIEVDVGGSPAYLSAPFTNSESFSIPFEGKIPGYIPAVTQIPSPDYTVPTLQWPSNYYPSLAEAQVPALPATLAGSKVKHTESSSGSFPATQAVMWGFPLEPSHGIARPYWRDGCHALGRDECCSYLDGRHDQHYGEVCVAATQGTFSTGNMCEPQCVVTGDCPWGTGSNEVVNVAMCADQAEHWVNFEHLFSTLDLDNFWNYDGSLTAPPCSEVVDWYILMSPAHMSESQFMKLQTATGEVVTNGNFRPPQSINGRVPEGCTMYSSPWIGKADAPTDTYPYNQNAWNNAVEDAHAACAVGTLQSPINLDACVAKRQPEMELDWGTQVVSLALDHGLKITPSGSVSSTIKGTTYTLQQCQWHLGSEHTVDDHQHVMESHCVHSRGTTERYGVVGMFWEEGRRNAFLDEIEDSLPSVPAPSDGPMVGHISCGDGVMAESCDVCGSADQCGSPDGDCEPGSADPSECVLRTRDCGKGIHVQGSCADCPADQCDSSQCSKSGSSLTCAEALPRRLTEDSQVVGTVPATGGLNSEVISIPASRAIPSSEPFSFSASYETTVPGGTEPGLVPDVGQISLTPGLVSDFQTSSHSLPDSVPATSSELMDWGFPVLPDHSLQRRYAPDGCTSLNLETCCFYMDGVRDFAADGPQQADLHALAGNAYGEPCRPVKTSTFSGTAWSCAPECWVTGDCEWYLSAGNSREQEAGVCWDRFATQSNGIDMNLLFSGLDLTRYWSYEGSFTAPPCSEVVDWFVLMDPAELSPAQLNRLEVAIGYDVAAGNFRPPQALNGRMVDGCVHHPEWYKGEYIDEEWGYYVEGAHPVCAVGQHQSPIDVTSCVHATDRAPINTVWGMLDFKMTQTGHAVKLSLTSTGAATVIGGVHYTLKQCNFHWGSEHSIDQLQHRMETQCVHTKDHNAGMYGVVGLFYQVGEFSNAFMVSIEDDLPTDLCSDGGDDLCSDDEVLGSVDFDVLMAGINMNHYWSYDGSFTAPPCTEVVDWYLLMDHADLTEEQFSKFQLATGHAGGMASANGNFRPPQPLNGRQVLGCGSVPDVQEWSNDITDLYPYSADSWESDVQNAHALCSMGFKQSPINLDSCLSDPQPEMLLTWGMQTVLLRGVGEVRVTLPPNTVHSMIKGTDYMLEECHFRFGSEHQVDGGQFHLEMQCVHSQELGRYGVIATLFHLGKWESDGNDFLGQVVNNLPWDSSAAESTSEGDLAVEIALDFSSLLNMLDKTRYWSYEGSMTTPPCTEYVDWFVLMDSLEMSVSQLDVIKAAIGVTGGNFRPPQPLHDRPVAGCARNVNWYSADNMNWAYDVHGHHAICDHGLKQSPIDISVCDHVLDRPPMELTWGAPSGILTNNGHSVVFTLDGTSALSVIVNKHYTLTQCDFHWGSEHFVEGMQQRMEVQCVHTKNGHAGKYGVIGMFYRVGSVSDASNFVALIEDQLPSQGDEERVQSLALEDLVETADLQHFWSYDGSFTTPPCTEVVDWYVLMDHGIMSSGQYDKFQTAIGLADPAGGNFRIPQPLNGRYIDGCHSHADDSGDMCAGGTQQSPINLDQCTAREVAQLPLVVEWGQQTVTISSAGDLKLDLVGENKPTSILKGTAYTLLGCSFHSTSEHTVYTNSYDLELQCLHQGYTDANDVTMGIVSIFFETGSESSFVLDFASDLDALPDTEGVNFDNLWSGIDRSKYWDYKGSLTTSPCTENVDWYVMMQVSQLSSSQLSAITSTIGSNNFRPPQALNGRVVGGCVATPLQYPYNDAHWGDESQECSDGMMQSPIDLSECSAQLAQPAINMDLNTQQVEVMNTGNTVKLSAENPVSATMVGEVAYTLQHCEFHWGSEHFVEHMQQRFEAQCVHSKVLESGRYGVVAIFFRLGSSDNAFFAPFEDSLQSTTGVQRQANFDLLMADLDTRHYWSYEGSFTAPPCTEVVDWYVMMDSSMLSSAQFDKFQMAIGWIEENGNFRPPQQLNNRVVVGCQDPDFVPQAPVTTTVPLPPYEEVHAGACLGGWLGTNLKTGSVNGCHLACLDMPACGYFSYNDIDNTCARYSPFQRCPEDAGNRYPTYQSFRENRNIFENPRVVSSYDMVHEGPCASGWLSSQNARMDTAEDCSQWCAGHLICRYFAFSSSSQMCSLYSAYSMCPARTDDRYAGTDWMSYILYTAGEEVHPAAPTPEENQNFFFVHQGHCAAGWMSGHNAHVASLEECITKCFMTPTCGYISYSEGATTCSLYRGNARCPADNNYPDFVSYRIAMV